MTSRDFCYWLQGVLEGNPAVILNEIQLELVKNHLNMVFIHEIDPSFPASQQVDLSKAHGGQQAPENVKMRC